ncbi:MA3 domain containing protein [Cryptosporidium ubiquitum]|uniref:MA3 domain containing protein n=1 Tax=Cryptosporidium ubiquitum TaxID=857276 RepID=A0A1J4MG27_9CRYT|nr:MA3 domain containing protein [Cryptosporidium ubiquitum]OII71805.1 MA3 domain containing protein [Cryptosporidium ubiquitum]
MEDESPIGSPILILDKKDPVFNSESEDENVSYSVIDVEKRERMVEAFSWSPQGRGAEAECKISIEEFRIRIKNLCQDYFLDYKTQDFINGLKCISCPSLHNLVIVIAVRMALDYSLSVQQQVSALLTILKDSHLITQQQIEDGLEKLIQSIDDICLDAPYSPERLECLVDCAIVDGIIPSNFRCRYPEAFLNKLIELRRVPDSNLQEICSANEINGLILHLKTLRKFKSFILENEEDFFSSGFNVAEVEKIISDAHLAAYRTAFWNGIDWTSNSFADKASENDLVPSTLCFNHEFVKNIVIASMSRNNLQRELVSNGLNLLSPSIINSVDISIGFMRLLGNLDDLSLDVLNACDLTTKFITRCIVDELLPPSFITVNSILHMGGPGGTQALNMSEQFLRNKPRNLLRYQTQNIWLQNGEEKEDMIIKMKVSEVLNEYSICLDKRKCIKTLYSLPLTQTNKKYLVKYIILHFIEKILSGSDDLLFDHSNIGNQPNNSFLEFCDREMRGGISLLEYLLSQGFLDEEAIMEGFHIYIDTTPDLASISPRTKELFSVFVSKAIERALLPFDWKTM